MPFGSAYLTSLILNGSAVDASLLTAPKNRIVSGDTRSSSNQPQFIDPNGAAASFSLTGASVNLVLDINGVAVTVNTDITKSSLTVGPSTTATALVNIAGAADGLYTQTTGEKLDGNDLVVDNMGAEFQAFIGQYCVIKIAGVATEYALAFVESATVLNDIYRGYFTDSSGAPVNRTAFTDNDTITVLSTGWVFVENDGTTVDVSYVTPIRSFVSPTSPATGDYWYDMANETWKRYDGASWQIINRTLVGVVGIDATNCVCARSFDFYSKFSETNSVEVEVLSTSVVQVKNNDSKVNVYGTEISFGTNKDTWNITTDLAGSADMINATEQASTHYFLYLKDTGETVISDIFPYDRGDLLGKYHPHNPWRLIGGFYNDGSSNIVSAYSDILPITSNYKSDAGQVIGTGYTDIIFEDIVFDDHRLHDIATGEYTMPRRGEFDIDACMITAAVSNAGGDRAIHFHMWVNGAELDLGRSASNHTASGSHQMSPHYSRIMKLNRGDVILLRESNSINATTMASNAKQNWLTIKEVTK